MMKMPQAKYGPRYTYSAWILASAIAVYTLAALYLLYYVLTLPSFWLVTAGPLIWWAYTRNLQDPFPAPRSHRDRVEVCIVGAGLSGLCMGIKLKQQGVWFRILEKAPCLGGTWQANKYPGCRCDVNSIMYQYSFFMSPDWSCMVAPSDEIQDYLEMAARHYDLKQHISFGTEVKSTSWSEEEQEWRIKIAGNPDVIHTSHLVSACGALQSPVFPDIPGGIGQFQGLSAHSGQWDRSQNLAGKRVALVGTGASAVQIAPEIVGQVKSLHVFQRTPNWLLPASNPTLPSWFPKFCTAFPWIYTLLRLSFFLIAELVSFITMYKGVFSLRSLTEWALADWQRAQVNHDPHLVDKVVPSYELGCKRVLFSSAFLPIFVENKHAHLITDPIEEVTQSGLRTSSQSYQFDVIIYATGFSIEDSMNGFEVQGRKVSLRAQLEENPCAYLGMTVPGFPNFFLLLGPNTILAHTSVIYMIECQVNYVTDVLRQMVRADLSSVEPHSDVTRSYKRLMRDWTERRTLLGRCVGWYRRQKDGVNFIMWPHSIWMYWWMTRKADLVRDYKMVSRTAVDKDS